MGTTEFILALLGALGISNVITFFLTKKRYITEVDSQQIKNVEDSFELYKKMMEETLEAQRKMMETRISDLQKENEFLRKQVDTLRNQMIDFLGVKLAKSGGK